MPILRKAGDTPKRSLWQRIKDIALADVNVLARGGVKAGSIDGLEELLLEADFGVPVTLRLVEDVKRLAMRGDIKTEAEFLGALRNSIASALRIRDVRSNAQARHRATPTVIVVIGVNGAGKTTFIAKLAARLRGRGKARDSRSGATRSGPAPSTSSRCGRVASAQTSSADNPAAIRRLSRSMRSTQPRHVALTSSSSTRPGDCTRATA